MATKFVAIVADELDEEQLLDGLRKTVKEEIKASDEEFAKTYRTWRHKPDFDKSFDESLNEIEGEITTSGDGSSQHPYPFVTKGTSVRFATMTPDFEAKTVKRVIGSKGGRGGVAYVDTRRPRPGIEAREFEEEIARQEQPKFKRRGQNNLDDAARKSNHAI
jgi:hypothetical protein